MLPESEEARKQSQPLTDRFEYTLFVIVGFFIYLGQTTVHRDFQRYEAFFSDELTL